MEAESKDIPPGGPADSGVLADAERIDADAALIDFMRQRDVPCPACRYNLRNLATPACPECGSVIMLGVQQADPYMRAWIAGTVALALPCGFSAIFLILLMHEQRWPRSTTWWATYFYATLSLSPLLLAGMLVWRRRFMLLDRTVQRLIALTFAGNDALALIILLCLVFGW